MPIKEKSFRIGCGRYLQEAGILQSLGEEVLRLGKFPLVVGGKTALDITRERIENSVKDVCEKKYRRGDYHRKFRQGIPPEPHTKPCDGKSDEEHKSGELDNKTLLTLFFLCIKPLF